jgi:hypothetical protein
VASRSRPINIFGFRLVDDHDGGCLPHARMPLLLLLPSLARAGVVAVNSNKCWLVLLVSQGSHEVALD